MTFCCQISITITFEIFNKNSSHIFFGRCLQNICTSPIFLYNISYKGQTWHFVKVCKNIVRIKEYFFVVYAAEGHMIISKILRTFLKRKKGLYKLNMRTCFTFLQIKHEKTFLTFRNIVFFELLIPTQLFFDPYDILTNFHKMQCLMNIKKYCRRKYAKYIQFIKYFVNIALKNCWLYFC